MPVIPAKEAEVGGQLRPVEIEGAGERKEERKEKKKEKEIQIWVGRQQRAVVLSAVLRAEREGREAIERAFHEHCHLCSYSYRATENCRERTLPVHSNGSLSAPLFFGQ